MDNPVNVLFLCTGNSARSILAEAILNRIGRARFRGFSAGSQPKGAVNPHALDLLKRLGCDVSYLRSKTWDEFARAGALKMHFIFTLCDSAAAETCPIWPGHPASAHWGLADPAAAADGSPERIAAAFRAAYATLAFRLSQFVRLPFGALDRSSLKLRLNDIGTRDCPLVPIKPGTPAFEKMRALLAAEGLPTSDLLEGGARYLAIGADAFGGLVTLGTAGLLRSITVAPQRRGEGLGALMLEELVAEARMLGIRDLWLLTTNAKDFFARHGFDVAPRSEAPEEVAGTAQFRDLCPETATLMRRRIAP
ncbi:MAG: GNAT family N-acetyltransferase [Alphaproteobacteria bacterium]